MACDGCVQHYLITVQYMDGEVLESRTYSGLLEPTPQDTEQSMFRSVMDTVKGRIGTDEFSVSFYRLVFNKIEWGQCDV